MSAKTAAAFAAPSLPVPGPPSPSPRGMCSVCSRETTPGTALSTAGPSTLRNTAPSTASAHTAIGSSTGRASFACSAQTERASSRSSPRIRPVAESQERGNLATPLLPSERAQCQWRTRSRADVIPLLAAAVALYVADQELNVAGAAALEIY